MNAAPPFELTATYDAASLRAASRVLFKRQWMLQLRLMTGAIVAVYGAALMAWYFRARVVAWAFAAYPLLFPILWMFSYWAIQRRLMRRLGKSVQVRMTVADFSIASEGEAHTFPWSQFKSTSTDEHNLYLFLTKKTAFVVPRQSIAPDALQFAISRAGVNGAAT